MVGAGEIVEEHRVGGELRRIVDGVEIDRARRRPLLHAGAHVGQGHREIDAHQVVVAALVGVEHRARVGARHPRPHGRAGAAGLAHVAVGAHPFGARAHRRAVGPRAAAERRRWQRRGPVRPARRRGRRAARARRGLGVVGDGGDDGVDQQRRHAVDAGHQRGDHRQLRRRLDPHHRRTGRGVGGQRLEARQVARLARARPRPRIELEGHRPRHDPEQRLARDRPVDGARLAVPRDHHQPERVLIVAFARAIDRDQPAHHRGPVAVEAGQRQGLVAPQPPGQHLARRGALVRVPGHRHPRRDPEQIAQREVVWIHRIVGGAAPGPPRHAREAHHEPACSPRQCTHEATIAPARAPRNGHLPTLQ